MLVVVFLREALRLTDEMAQALRPRLRKRVVVR